MDAPGFLRLSLQTQTTYAQLLDRLVTGDAGVLSAATLVSKQIGGHRYWYVQRRHQGKKSQTYLGKETPELQGLIERWRRAREQAADRAELVAMARAGGAYVIAAAEARVLELLAPLFTIGGVLVGSHAFAVIGNALGVRWGDAIVRTGDVDIAHDPNIAIALAHDVDALEMRQAFDDAIPRFSLLDPSSPATSFQIRGTKLEVDLLTPLIGRARSRPVKIPALGAAAMPLRFLDYLIEETQPGAVVAGSGVLVNVPRPGRYALHKLIVAGRRTSAKSVKDREQAGVLLRVLMADLPGEISLAWKAIVGRGKAWTDGVRASIARLDDDIIDGVKAFGIRPKVRS
jgi:hypothetical protein